MSWLLFAAACIGVAAIALYLNRSRDRDWNAAAARLGGTFVGHAAVDNEAFLQVFGPAPWHAWPGVEDLACTRLLERVEIADGFSIFELHYREWSTGTSTPFDVTLAVVPAGAEALGRLERCDAPAGFRAAHNGVFVFAWKASRGIFTVGKTLRPREFDALLEAAREAARMLPAHSLQPSGVREAEASEVAHAQDAPPDRTWAVVLGYGALVFAAFVPGRSGWDLPLLGAWLVLMVFGLDWRRVSSGAHLSILLGVALAILGVHRGNALMLFGIPIGLGLVVVLSMLATPKTTRLDESGVRVWRNAEDP